MSSNLTLNKICQHCGTLFIARKTSTKFCSVPCAQRNYKVRERMVKVSRNEKDTREQTRGSASIMTIQSDPPALIDIAHLSYVTSLSKRTLFRLLKDPQFPKIKVGRRLLFSPSRVVAYLQNKFGSSQTSP